MEDRLLRAGELPYRRFGRTRYVAARDLERLLPGDPPPKAADEDRIVVMPKRWA